MQEGSAIDSRLAPKLAIRIFAEWIPACFATAAGISILWLALVSRAWLWWPVIIYGAGLSIAWWPIRPRPGTSLLYGILVLATLAQAVTYMLITLPFITSTPAVSLEAVAGESSPEVGLGVVLLTCPSIGILAVVGARRGAVLAATQLLVPFVFLLWVLGVAIADAG